MDSKRFLGIFLFCCLFFVVKSQDLKDLRVRPDTVISSQQERPLNIKTIRPVVPKLDLEVDYWKHWTKFGVNLNQATFNDDWQGGGVNSVSVGLIANHKSDFTKDNFNFVTEMDLKYGKIRNRGQLAKKNNDRIFWDNKLSYKLSTDWALYTSLTFESQFDAGYSYTKVNDEEVIDTILTAFMAPGYLTESLGLEYKPSNAFSLRFGTGTARQTFILDDRIRPREGETKFGVEGDKSFNNDLAFQLTANLDKNLSPNLNVKSRYNLFANYEKVGDPAHRLDLTVTAKVSRIVNVTLNGVMVYDSDVIAKVQLSQSLALGVLFSFPR